MMLSDEQRRVLRAVFPDRPDSACRFCGGYHLRAVRESSYSNGWAKVPGRGRS